MNKHKEQQKIGGHNNKIVGYRM